MISINDSVKLLTENDDILILTHKSPDGDTLGCAFALYSALKSLSKRARILCNDEIPNRFEFLKKGYEQDNFQPKFIVSVDVAAVQLLGDNLALYADKIDLCIDHHPSNGMFAKASYVDQNASAACEIIFEVINLLNVKITQQMANCLYTGIATDSGCFKYSNTTKRTHEIAAKLFESGCEYEQINRVMFEQKSKTRIRIEQQALSSIEYFYNDQVAVIAITKRMVDVAGADESELDGVSAIPRTIEGVEVGITMREQADGTQKVSIRTACRVDASKLCSIFGGGGHMRAAGCLINENYETAKRKLISAIKPLIAE